MLEEELAGAGDPGETPKVSEKGKPATEKPTTEDAQLAGALQEQKDGLTAKHEKEINELRGAEQKAAAKLLKEKDEAWEQRFSSVQAQMSEIGQRALGEEEYAQVQQKTPDPHFLNLLKAGTLMTEGRQMGLSLEEMEQLLKDPSVTHETWRSAARETLLVRQQEERNKEDGERWDRMEKSLKQLVQEKEDVKAAAQEEIAKVRKDTGADSIPSGGPEPEAPMAELKQEYEEKRAELNKAPGDRRSKLRDLNAYFAQRGWNPDTEDWYGKP